MSIKELTAVMKPPERPADNGSPEGWQHVQRELGLELPPDLREFGLTYGSGKLVNLGVVVLNPLAPGYVKSVRWTLEGLRTARANEAFSEDVFPHKPGLFPWGWDENGADLCWLTDDLPAHWCIALRSHGESKFVKFHMTLTAFLARLLGRKLHLRGFWTQDTLRSPDVASFEPERDK